MGKIIDLLRFLLTFADNSVKARWILTAVVAAGIFSGLSATGLIALVNTLLHAEGPAPRLVGAFVALCVLLPAMRFLASWLIIRLAQDTVLNLRVYLGRRILATPLVKLEQMGSSRLLSTMTQDVSALTGAFTGIPTFFTQGAIVVGCLVYLGWLSPQLLVLVGAVVLIGVASHHFLIRRAHAHFRSFRNEWDVMFKRFRGVIHGAKELKLNRRRRDDFLDEHLLTTAQGLRTHALRGRTLSAFANSWGQALFFLLIGVVLLLVPRIGLEVGQVASGYVLTILYMLGPLNAVMGLIPSISQATVSAEKVAELGGNLSETEEGEDRSTPELASAWSKLRLEEAVHTYYREREDRHFQLGPVSFETRPGELVFIVGGNGSGKTTLAKMILGLYEPERGGIYLDEHRIRGVLTDAYRQLFAVVFNDFFLFDHLLGLERAELDERARGYLRRLQLDHKVEVDGGELSTLDLSQGQRKRLALLTAFLEERPIYLFDEWAADQDPEFKAVFYREILADLKARGKTVFVISHDDAYYHLADRILRLDDGQLTYDGPSETYLAGRPPAARLAEAVV